MRPRVPEVGRRMRWGLLAAAITLSAQAQISPPALGHVRLGGSSSIQTLFGVPGSFVFGPATLGAAEAASFSDKAALVASEGTIRLVRNDGTLLAKAAYSGAAPPVLSVSDEPETAVAWLPGNRTLLTYNGRKFAELALELMPAAAVTSVSLQTANRASLLLMQADGSVSQAVISLTQGSVASIDSLPGITGPAYRFGDYLLWRDENGCQIENASAGERYALRAPIGALTVERMSTQWLHLYFAQSNTHWALQLGRQEPGLLRMPVAAMSKEVRP